MNIMTDTTNKIGYLRIRGKMEYKMEYKQYVGISRDHSGSMTSLRAAAASDYNSNIQSIKEGATESGIDTVVSVIKCGVGRPGRNEFAVINSSVNSLSPVSSYSYSTDGSSTPLFDSVGELIEQLKNVPDAENSSVSFLVMVITDGEENSSKKYTGASLGKKIKELQKTDRWTFVFRVPYGYKRNLVSLGIPEGNVLEWEQTERGFEEATKVTTQALRGYYASRASGQRSTTRFYADLGAVPIYKVKKDLDDITSQVRFFDVLAEEQIRDFVERKLGGHSMLIGTAFYQLTKPEIVQGRKKICVRFSSSGKVYEGDAARQLMNIPYGGDIKLYPKDNPGMDIFVQSTSVNRKLLPGTEVLYWANAV